MTNPQDDAPSAGPAHPQGPPRPHRRLVRPREGRMVGGVCAGIADYSGVDVTIVRLVTVASVLFGFAGVLLYVAGLLLIPQE